MRYSKDPFWMTAKFSSVCSCGKRINRGDRIYYYPACKKAECEDCGRKGAALMEDELAYERQYACATQYWD